MSTQRLLLRVWVGPLSPDQCENSALKTSTGTAVPPVNFAHGKAAIRNMEGVAMPLALPAAVAPVSASEQWAITSLGQTHANVKQCLQKI